jgi:predicted dehydrogenase
VLCSRQAVRGDAAVGEDSAAVMLRLDGGTTAVAAISSAAPGHANTIQLELIGTTASMWWEQENPDQLWAGRLGGPVEQTMRSKQPNGVELPPTLQMPAGHVAGYLDGFRDLIATVYDAIGGESNRDYPTFVDGARGVAVLDALVRSADRGQWIEVST